MMLVLQQRNLSLKGGEMGRGGDGTRRTKIPVRFKPTTDGVRFRDGNR